MIDTSVLIRYLIKPSAANRTLVEVLWVDDRFLTVSSPDLVGELEGVLARPSLEHLIHPDEGAALVGTIRARAEMLPALGVIPEYTRDRKDDKFVACAIAGLADYLVTTGEAILVLGEPFDVRMVTPRQFVADLGDIEPIVVAPSME